jgi:hypothetical protein
MQLSDLITLSFSFSAGWSQAHFGLCNEETYAISWLRIRPAFLTIWKCTGGPPNVVKPRFQFLESTSIGPFYVSGTSLETVGAASKYREHYSRDLKCPLFFLLFCTGYGIGTVKGIFVIGKITHQSFWFEANL